MSLRRRQYKTVTRQPVTYPAWRVWDDRRVRLDDAVLALFAAVRIARIGVSDRSQGEPTLLVSDLYTDNELDFRQAFQVTTTDAEQRWDEGQQELARSTILLGVAALDDLLAAAIGWLRQLGYDATEPGTVDTGVSAKLRHLVDRGGLGVSAGTITLHDLLLAARNAVTHHGAQQRHVRKAWERLDDASREWWEEIAGRSLPLTKDDAELVLADAEVLATFRTLDRVALDLNEALRGRLDDVDWATGVAAEFRSLKPAKAGDPARNVRAIRTHAAKAWRLDLDQAVIESVLRRE